MREIKFEIKLRRKDGTDSYFEHLTLDDLLNRNGSLFHPSVWEVVYKRQFTGRKDKNGMEIYEGDIVKLRTNFLKNAKMEEPTDFKEYTYSVKFFDGMFALDRGLPFNNGFVKEGELEIIGNIYENPELLTQFNAL